MCLELYNKNYKNYCTEISAQQNRFINNKPTPNCKIFDPLHCGTALILPLRYKMLRSLAVDKSATQLQPNADCVVVNCSARIAALRCVHSTESNSVVHSLLQRSCSTDVSITYLPQVNATHCSKVKN